MDIFTSEIIKDSIVALGEEMFQAMIRTSMSPIIYEATDFAVGATDAKGNLLAQGNGVAGFLATLDTAVQGVLKHYDLSEIHENDVFMTNSPYEGGGTHLSDVVLLVPVFCDGRLIAWTVNKAHWTEVGGMHAGSVTTMSTEIYQEGLHFRFLKIYDQGKLNKSLYQLIKDNVRLPDSTLGDLHAGVAAARVGESRIKALAEKYGAETLVTAMDELLDYGERMMMTELAKLPQGVYEAEDIVESDGHGNGPFPVKVKVTISAKKVTFDFTGTAAQAPGPINVTLSGLVTATRCVFKSITNPEIPANGGSFRAMEVICPEGTIFSAMSPAPVSVYYESDVACMDLVLKALAGAMKDRLPAGHYASVGATFLSGVHPDTGNFFVMGEPLAGGWGAAQNRDGDSGQFCALNGETFNIPCEIFESRYGVRIDQMNFHDHLGGEGEYLGGKGIMLDYRVTSDVVYLTFSAGKNETRPWAMEGANEGSNNYALILRADGTEERQSICTAVPVYKDEVIRIITATGGGYGSPKKRSHEQVAMDVKNGYLTLDQAAEHFNYQVAGS